MSQPQHWAACPDLAGPCGWQSCSLGQSALFTHRDLYFQGSQPAGWWVAVGAQLQEKESGFSQSPSVGHTHRRIIKLMRFLPQPEDHREGIRQGFPNHQKRSEFGICGRRGWGFLGQSLWFKWNTQTGKVDYGKGTGFHLPGPLEK